MKTALLTRIKAKVDQLLEIFRKISLIWK